MAFFFCKIVLTRSLQHQNPNRTQQAKILNNPMFLKQTVNSLALIGFDMKEGNSHFAIELHGGRLIRHLSLVLTRKVNYLG